VRERAVSADAFPDAHVAAFARTRERIALPSPGETTRMRTAHSSKCDGDGESEAGVAFTTNETATMG
jgi:hypothetical protein